MIAALGLLAAVMLQDTAAGLSPRAREMLSQIAPPGNGAVSVATRFSTDTGWIGQQVDLVTVAWLPRGLRDRLRRQPTLRTPALSGLWSAPSQATPILAETRRVDGQVYDLFVSHQILFPLGAGAIEAPPAVLSYAVPASTSFFAPEDRTTLQSRPSRLFVRPIPASLTARLGAGPTARHVGVQWRLPEAAVHAGTPVTVELVVSGEGNVTLWPAPEISWPVHLRVYTEPTMERIRRPAGVISGEKRFRYTVVSDSAGVLTLPRVRYPYFDPATVDVRVAAAAAVAIAVRPTPPTAPRRAVQATRILRPTVASQVIDAGWWALVLVSLAPLLLAWWKRRPTPVPVPVATHNLEEELRRLLGQPGDASPSRVAEALRRRGIARRDAEVVEQWLQQVDRYRWGPTSTAVPDDAVAATVVSRLRRRSARRRGGIGVLLVLGMASQPVGAQWDEALQRFADGDAAGAARLFEDVTRQEPSAPGAWLNLGAARAMQGDAVGSVAAWLRGTQVAPRDGRLHAAIRAVTTATPEVRRLAPVIPLSRDELLLLACAAWLATLALWRRTRRVAWMAAAVLGLALGTAVLRTVSERTPRGLLRPGAVLRVSPIPTAPVVVAADPWSVATVERQDGAWSLVTLGNARRGWVFGSQVAALSGLD